MRSRDVKTKVIIDHFRFEKTSYNALSGNITEIYICIFSRKSPYLLYSVIDSRISRIWSRFSIWNVLKKHFVSHQTHSDWLSRDDSLSSSILQLETEFLSSVFHFLEFGILDSQKLTFDFQYNNSDNLWVSFDRTIARPPRTLTVLQDFLKIWKAVRTGLQRTVSRLSVLNSRSN